jgi:hypothetical protein
MCTASAVKSSARVDIHEVSVGRNSPAGGGCSLTLGCAARTTAPSPGTWSLINAKRGVHGLRKIYLKDCDSLVRPFLFLFPSCHPFDSLQHLKSDLCDRDGLRPPGKDRRARTTSRLAPRLDRKSRATHQPPSPTRIALSGPFHSLCRR